MPGAGPVISACSASQTQQVLAALIVIIPIVAISIGLDFLRHHRFP
jgi:hypothetical protein